MMLARAFGLVGRKALGTAPRRAMTALSLAVAAASVAMGASVARADLFAPPVSFPVTGGALAWPVASGDYDGDGVADVLLGANGTSPIGFARGTAGGFGVTVTTPDNWQPWRSVADVDGDGLDDYVVVADLAPQRPMTVLVRLANGAGGFSAAIASDISTTDRATNGAVFADVNADGKPDAVAATQPQGVDTTILHIALGHGDGTFGPETTQTLSAAYSLAAGVELTGDGRADLVAFRRFPVRVVSLVALPGGTFSLRTTTALPSAPDMDLVGAIGGDFDGDGNDDAAITGYGNLWVLRGDGSGGLLPPAATTPNPGLGGNLASGDLDGDGLPDLIAADPHFAYGGLTPFISDGGGGLLDWGLYSCSTVGGCERPVVVDVDADGRLDVVAGAPGAVVVFRNIGRPAPVLVAPDGSDFGEQVVGTQTEALVLVVNDGERPMAVTGAQITGAAAGDFALVDGDCSAARLLGGELCAYVVRFTPSAIGVREAALRVSHSASSQPLVIGLAGIGASTPVPAGQAAAGQAGQRPTAPPPSVARLSARALLITLRPPARARVTLRSGRLRVGTLANPPVRSATVRLVAKVRRGGRRVATVVAQGRVAIARGSRRGVYVRLTATGTRALRQARRLTATLKITALDGSGRATVASTRIRLTAAR